MSYPELGPLITAVVYDTRGTCVPTLYVCAVALCIAALLATRLPATMHVLKAAGFQN